MADPTALFGIHATALQFQSRRMELIASNIANADTPQYKARDLDFKQVLAATTGQTAAPGVTNSQHIPVALSTALGTGAGTVYRTPNQPSADGNTVDLQTEQAAFADAALHYQASMSFVDGRLRSLMTALTGQ